MWPWQIIVFLLWETTSVFPLDLTKLSPALKTKVEKDLKGTDNVFVSFASTAPTLQAIKKQRHTPAARAENVRKYLINLALSEQAGVVNMLSDLKRYKFESMWLSNRIYIPEADNELIKQLSDSSNVTYVRRETFEFIMDAPWLLYGEEVEWHSLNENVTKGLELIQAPQAWEVLGGKSKSGEGVVVGVLDTGAFVEHEALRENFVGNDYGYLNGLSHINRTPDILHGTHVTGTIVGRNGIGVAPAAKFSHCVTCLDLNCHERAIEKCLEFFICPTLSDGTQSDCSRHVHVINLSITGSSTSLKPIFDAVVTAGIILVAPLGVLNYNGICGSGTYPGLFDDVIAVGAVDFSDKLCDYSSKGPNSNPTGHPKPDVVAPGVSCISANYKNTGNKYRMITGISTATPHVTGLVALLLTRDKTLTPNQVRKLIIENTDRPLPDKWGCDNKTRNTWPNSEFGYGRINALKALNAQTKILMGTNKNDSKLENTCQQTFGSYKKRFNETFRNINSVNIEIRQEVQKSVEDFERILHETYMFNATMKNLINKATKFEQSLKALEKV